MGLVAMLAVAACGEDDEPLATTEDSPLFWEALTPIDTSRHSDFGGSFIVTPGDHLFVTARKGGVYRSLDGGGTWGEVALDAYAQRKLFNSGTTLFATRPYDKSDPLESAGLLRSKDFGWSWQPVGLAGYRVTKFAASGDRLYVVTAKVNGDDGRDLMFRSADRGDSWAEVEINAERIRSIVASAKGVLIVPVGGDDGLVLRSANGTGPWTPVLSAWIREMWSDGAEVVCLTGPNWTRGSLSPGRPARREIRYSRDFGNSWTSGPIRLPPGVILLFHAGLYVSRNGVVVRYEPTQRHSTLADTHRGTWVTRWRTTNLESSPGAGDNFAASDTYLYAAARSGQVYRVPHPD